MATKNHEDVRTVYLVRHGETAANDDGKTPELERGWKSYPLDADGRSEAKRIAAKLAKLGIKAIVSSDLTRAKQTANIVSDWLGIEPTFDSGLRTWNTGRCAGQLKKNVEPHIANLVRHHPDERCSGGESFDEFCSRIFACFKRILANHTENPLAVVIHARVERLLEASDHLKHRKIDIDTFLAKPEAPGHIEKWTVNPQDLSWGSQKSQRVSGSTAARANTLRVVGATTPTSS